MNSSKFEDRLFNEFKATDTLLRVLNVQRLKWFSIFFKISLEQAARFYFKNILLRKTMVIKIFVDEQEDFFGRR